MAGLAQNQVVWEVGDNYQKQTYRNRCYICTDQGKHSLSIPIKHVGGDQGRQKYKDVRLKNDYPWQRQHWRTLQTAYRTSPFFEYYEDEVAPLFENEYKFLLDFNLKTIQVICDCLQINTPKEHTDKYENQLPQSFFDARYWVNCKKEKLAYEQKEYIQVFGDRHGFIKNTSILDLLFNEGPNALSYLRDINLKLGNA